MKKEREKELAQVLDKPKKKKKGEEAVEETPLKDTEIGNKNTSGPSKGQVWVVR